MNKKQVAKYLGVSTKAIERYTQAGKLTPKYERKPSGGQIAIFDDAQVKALKLVMEKPKEQSIQVERRRNKTGQDSNNLVLMSQLAELTKSLLVTVQAGQEKVALADKLLLTLTEAAALAGLSEATLAGSIKTGDLSGRTLDGKTMIRRVDLESLINKLWRKQIRKKPAVKKSTAVAKNKPSKKKKRKQTK